MKKAAKVFLIFSAIFGWWMIFPLVIAVKNIRRINNNVPISVGKKIVVLIFCNWIAGILLLCAREDGYQSRRDRLRDREYDTMVLPEEPTPGKGFGVASLVLGIAGLILCSFGGSVFVSAPGLLFALLAKKKGESKLSKAGLILSIIGLALGVIVLIILLVNGITGMAYEL